MKTIFAAAACAAALAAASGASAVTSFVTVSTTDNYYTSFTGSVAYGATGASSELHWQTSGYHWSGDIQIVNGAGKAVVDIVTGNDAYNLYTSPATDPTLGTTCVAAGKTFCVSYTPGTTFSIEPQINAGNGGLGIYKGGDVRLTVGGVPEPTSWALMIVGLGVMGAAVRGRRRGFAA